MKTRTNWIYLVYCNPTHPLVYGVYTNKIAAVKYAKKLISWRFEDAKKRGNEFGYYHNFESGYAPDTEFDKREKYIFSACLKIKDNGIHYTDDACLVQVIRRAISK